PLLTGNLRKTQIGPGRSTARAVVPRLDAAIVRVVGRDIEHTEAALRRDPGLGAIRRKERVGRIVAEVIMTVAGIVFEQSIRVTAVAIAIGIPVTVRVTDMDIGI